MNESIVEKWIDVLNAVVWKKAWMRGSFILLLPGEHKNINYFTQVSSYNAEFRHENVDHDSLEVVETELQKPDTTFGHNDFLAVVLSPP